jgi:hypothetical protein
VAQYLLSPHAFVCEADGHAVFLDLKKDKYTAVTPEDLRALRGEIRGWPGDQPAPSDWHFATSRRFRASGKDSEVIKMLADEGLLTTDACVGKEALPPRIELPARTLRTRLSPRPQISIQDVGNFVRSWAVASLMLRVLPLHRIVERVRHRKEREEANAPELDLKVAHRLTAIHQILQPAFYSANDACLRNSLTLLEFLAKYGLYPEWVFGVRLQPFLAHSWVQQGAVVFTDPTEYVVRFTPIMTV